MLDVYDAARASMNIINKSDRNRRRPRTSSPGRLSKRRAQSFQEALRGGKNGATDQSPAPFRPRVRIRQEPAKTVRVADLTTINILHRRPAEAIASDGLRHGPTGDRSSRPRSRPSTTSCVLGVRSSCVNAQSQSKRHVPVGARLYAGRSAVVRIEAHGKKIVIVAASTSSTVGVTSLHPCFAVTRLPPALGPSDFAARTAATWSRRFDQRQAGVSIPERLRPVTGVPIGVIRPAIC